MGTWCRGAAALNEYGLRPFFSGGPGRSRQPAAASQPVPDREELPGYNLGGGAVGSSPTALAFASICATTAASVGPTRPSPSASRGSALTGAVGPCFLRRPPVCATGRRSPASSRTSLPGMVGPSSRPSSAVLVVFVLSRRRHSGAALRLHLDLALLIAAFPVIYAVPR